MARLIDQIQGHAQVWERLLAAKRHEHLPHALVFTGPAGVGKKRVAWAFAQALLCEGSNPPCGECGACKRIESQQSESVLLLEPQKGVIKLEAAAAVLEFLSLRRLTRARVVIVDQAQQLNPQTANALLKAIEEPPPETFFILIVPEISQLLPTLRSRVQNVRFAPLSEEVLKADPEASEWMRRSARGSFEQLEVFKNPEAQGLRELAVSFLRDAGQDVRQALEQTVLTTKDRETALQFTRLLQQILRDWSVLESGDILHSDLGAQLRALPQVDPGQRVRLWHEAFRVEMDLNAHVDRSLVFENFYCRARATLR